MSDTDESLSRVLRSFRPLGESQAIDQALRMLAVRANTDEELRKQLLQDPLDVLRSLNVPVNPDAKTYILAVLLAVFSGFLFALVPVRA